MSTPQPPVSKSKHSARRADLFAYPQPKIVVPIESPPSSWSVAPRRDVPVHVWVTLRATRDAEGELLADVPPLDEIYSFLARR